MAYPPECLKEIFYKASYTKIFDISVSCLFGQSGYAVQYRLQQLVPLVVYQEHFLTMVLECKVKQPVLNLDSDIERNNNLE